VIGTKGYVGPGLYYILLYDYWRIPGGEIFIHKNIPAAPIRGMVPQGFTLSPSFA